MPADAAQRHETTNIALPVPPLLAQGLGLRPASTEMPSTTVPGIHMYESTRERASGTVFTTKPLGKASGLGLAPVYGIVNQSGGGVSLESGPGLGAIVRIYLPATTAIDPPRTPEVQRISKDAGTETVLLVEDNEAVRDLTARALRRRGYTVHEARDGEGALHWMQTGGVRPHLLLTDVVMPGVSGPNLAARLKIGRASCRVDCR